MRFSIFLFFVSFQLLFSQENRHEISLSAFYDRVNQNYSEFNGLIKKDLQFKDEYSIQIHYNYFFSRNFFLESGFNYSRRGFVTENTNFTTSYFQIPAQVGLLALNSRFVNVSPFFGCYLGIPTSNKSEVNHESLSIDNERLDFGLEIGGKIMYKFNNNYSFLMIPRIQYGLSTAFKEYHYESRSNFAISIGVGIAKSFN